MLCAAKGAVCICTADFLKQTTGKYNRVSSRIWQYQSPEEFAFLTGV